MIYWSCKRCAEGLEAPECLAGERLRCPNCKRLCRVPEAVESAEVEAVLVESGAAASSQVAERASSNGNVPYAVAMRADADIDLEIVERSEQPPAFAESRITNDVMSAPSSPEVPDSIAADEPEPETPVVEELGGSAPLIEIASPLEPMVALPIEELQEMPAFVEAEGVVETEADVIVESDDLVESVSTNGSSHSAMDELISDAVDQEIAEHATVNGSRDDAAALFELTSQPTVEAPPAAQPLVEQQTLEDALEALAPVIQRQLGPAVAQYSSREQARSAMFARAVVDVYPGRLSVRSHEEGRIVMVVRYRRILRRTMIGTKPLADLNIEVSFVRSEGQWTLERWQRIVSV